MTTCWSSRSGGLLSAFWRPAGAVYLACCLTALAAGLWPEGLMPPEQSTTLTPPPTLQTLAVGQVVFVMLVYPLVLWRRRSMASLSPCCLHAAAESVGLLVVTIPLYITAGFFADATTTDVIRTAIAVALLLPAAWTAGLLLARGLFRPVVLVVLISAVVGGPAMVYIVLEFLPELATGAGEASPVVLLWRTAVERQTAVFPEPLWSALLWPGLAGAGFLAQMLVPHRYTGQEAGR